jgi:hypothetical protein
MNIFIMMGINICLFFSALRDPEKRQKTGQFFRISELTNVIQSIDKKSVQIMSIFMI